MAPPSAARPAPVPRPREVRTAGGSPYSPLPRAVAGEFLTRPPILLGVDLAEGEPPVQDLLRRIRPAVPARAGARQQRHDRHTTRPIIATQNSPMKIQP